MHEGVVVSRVPASAAILSDRIRRIVIEQSKRANVGHIGSSLSVADILGTLYAGVLQGDGPDDPERDRFVLSKGHASLALYAALHETGVIDADELASFCVDGSRSARTPITSLPGVDFSTGSLGHGLSIATGSALAARLAGQPAAHVRADERCRVQRGLGLGGGHVRRPPPARRSRGDRRRERPAGARLHARRARSLAARRALARLRLGRPHGRRPRLRGDARRHRRALDAATGRPHVLLAQTVFGTGVSYMEREIEWHYLPMDDAQYATALAELGAPSRSGRSRHEEGLRQALAELADDDPRVLLLTGDLGFMAVEPFAERHPDRFINAGVAEQNMVGMATGLAEAGYVPFVYSIATFAALRSYEFIRNGPVLHDLPVRIVGVGPGLDYGPNGITHWALEDVAVLRPLPGLAVIAPGRRPADRERRARDGRLPGPAYLRLARMGPDDRGSRRALRVRPRARARRRRRRRARRARQHGVDRRRDPGAAGAERRRAPAS